MTDDDDDARPSDWRSYARVVGAAVATHKRIALAILAALVLEMAFTAAVPLSFKYLIDHAILERDARVLVTILGGLVIGVVVVAFAGIGRDYLYAKLSAQILRGLRVGMFDHLQRLSMEYYARARVADIQARFTTDLASVDSALAAVLPWGALPALDLALSSVLLFVLEWKLALVAMLAFPLSLLGPRLIGPRAGVAGYARKQHESAVLGEVQENFVAHSLVKAFGLEHRARARFGAHVDTLRASHVRVGFLTSLMERSSSISSMVLQVTVLGVGAAMAFHGSLSVGSLASFQALFLTMSYSLGYVTQYVPYLVQAGAGMRRIDELLAETPRIADGPDAVAITTFDTFAFEHVTFGYTPDRRQLVDATFTLHAGQTVAFVGASGSGKSTVLNLLMRFYDPDGGRVAVDGRDLRAIARHSLREQMGVVFQDSILFDTTIRENIRVGKLDATDAEIEAAARAAEVHEMVAAMPAGYDTLVGERGSRLSGGQRQRIAIARALLREPRILLLDEATSALDAATEAAINDTLAHVTAGRTVISVTHRLAAVTAFDRICVLDRGALVEDGRHDALVAAGGTYARLWEKQQGFTIGRGEALIQPARLRAIEIFASVDEALLATLTEILVIERHPANRAVFHEGDPGDKLYIISRGRVSVFVGVDDARAELGVLDDGDHFGEIALLEDTVRTASVRTLTECTFLTLPRDAFQRLLERDPALRTAFESVADTRHARPGAR